MISIKHHILLCCCFCLFAKGALAVVSPHDEKTCIEGTDFDIKRVRQLIVEGKEVRDYGEWERKTFTISGPEIASSYHHWCYPEWLKKNRKPLGSRRTTYSLHIKNDPSVVSQLRSVIAVKTGVRVDNLSETISIPHIGEGELTAWNDELEHWDRYVFFYHFRADKPKFEVTNEYWKILNTRAQKVIASICHPKSSICLDSSNKVFLGKYPLTRQCWKEELTYHCKTEPQYGCQSLRDQGYELYRSSCLDKQEDLCLKWKRYYIRPQDAEYDSSKFSVEGEGVNTRAAHRRPRVFNFPRSGNSTDAAMQDGQNESTHLSGKNAPNHNNTKSQNKNNGFQKYQSIPTKSSGSGINGSSIKAGGSKNANHNEYEAVIAKSIPINPDFLLPEGTYIPCSLNNRFVSEVAGRIQCMINQDVYSSSGRVKLIERGTKAIGMYQTGSLQYGMSRMYVIWTKLLTPDHKRVNLVDTQVVGRLGEAGIDGRVNAHFLQRFGGALMMSLIKDLVANVSNQHTNNSKRNTININSYEHTKDSTTSIVERMLESSVNIPPTMYKKQGDIIGIEIGKDIDFSKIYQLRGKP